MDTNTNEYIEYMLTKQSKCHDIMYKGNSRSLDTTVVHEILKTGFISGNLMKAVQCFFTRLFYESGKYYNSKNEPVDMDTLSTAVHAYIKSMKQLGVSSASGYVFFMDFVNKTIQVIMKIPQSGIYNVLDMKREYFIGLYCMNNMRYLLPNFMYTLGGFMCTLGNPRTGICANTGDPEYPFMVLEKINGQSLYELLRSDTLVYEDLVSIILQILVALDVAQREYQFTHHDMHVANVMVRKSLPGEQYTVQSGHYTYTFQNLNYVAVIIDYGRSSVKHKHRYIGTDLYRDVYNFMVPGEDMYRVVTSMYYYLKNVRLREQFSALFSFFEQDEPYQYNTRNQRAKEGVQDYFNHVPYSQIATYTPDAYLHFLFTHTYSHLPHNMVSRTPRMVYDSLEYNSARIPHNAIFNDIERGYSQTVGDVLECIGRDSETSLVMMVYYLNLLLSYGNMLINSPQIKAYIEHYKDIIYRNRKVLLNNDLVYVDELEKIEPLQHDYVKKIQYIVSGTMLDDMYSLRKYAVDNAKPLKKHAVRMDAYVQFIYTASQVSHMDADVEYIYTRLVKSRAVREYMSNNSYESTLRWVKTLKASLQVKDIVPDYLK